MLVATLTLVATSPPAALAEHLPACQTEEALLLHAALERYYLYTPPDESDQVEIWRETNGVGGLQTGGCTDADGQHRAADRFGMFADASQPVDTAEEACRVATPMRDCDVQPPGPRAASASPPCIGLDTEAFPPRVILNEESCLDGVPDHDRWRLVGEVCPAALAAMVDANDVEICLQEIVACEPVWVGVESLDQTDPPLPYPDLWLRPECIEEPDDCLAGIDGFRCEDIVLQP